MKIIDKISSRKFIVWNIWTLLVFINQPHIAVIIPWYGLITIIYIGGNVLDKFLDKDSK